MVSRQYLQEANAFWDVSPTFPYDDSNVAKSKHLLRQLEGIRWLIEFPNRLQEEGISEDRIAIKFSR